MNKKGVSEMIGYVLLIVIAIGLSVMVFAFLKLYVPEERPYVECSDDINLIVNSAYCNYDAGNLTITLANKGLFSIDGVYVRMDKAERKIRLQINKNHENLYYVEGASAGNSYLPPGKSFTYVYNDTTPRKIITELDGDYILEVQPAIVEKGIMSACENAVITQPIKCIAPPSST